MKLEWLDVSYNELEEVPSEIGQLTNLEVLHLEGNRLSRLPPTLVNCTMLDT